MIALTEIDDGIFVLRTPCACGCLTGRVHRNGHATVRCTDCGSYAYNAPKKWTSREPRSVETVRRALKQSTKSAVLLRSTGRCELCGTKSPLQVAHVLAISIGLRLGLSDEDINHDHNLAALCEPCNSGLSDTPVPLRLLVALLKGRQS